METNERVVVIKGNSTKWYSQAVFFMNPTLQEEAVPVDLVAEAEKIIYDYVANKRKLSGDGIHAYLHQPDGFKTEDSFKKRLSFDFLLYVLMILACIGLAAVVWLGLLN